MRKIKWIMHILWEFLNKKIETEYHLGFKDGEKQGYQEGYADGYDEGKSDGMFLKNL